MKKRILAFALTLAMVVGSLSMLSFVTFAEEPEPATDFYAYRTTAKIDGAFATDEIFLPVYKEIAPNVAIGMAWDYDNLYFAMYQEPADEETPCAGADRKDFLSSATFNVSGVEIVVDYETKTVTSETEGVNGVVPGTHGLEFSVPLSVITLEATQLAAGVAATDMSFAIIQKQGEAQAENTIEGELNVILSGRSVLAMTNNINPVAPNNYTFSGHVYDRNKGGADSAAGYVTPDGTTIISSWSSQTWHVLDKDVKARSVEFLRNMNHINDFVSVLESDTGVHVEYELNIANLPVGTVTATDGIGGFKNGASCIHVFFEGAHSSTRNGVLGYIYNDATYGLSYKYVTAAGTLASTVVDLGVGFNEQFVLGFNATAADANTIKVEVLVNDEVIHTYNATAGINYGLTGDTGFTCLAYNRGSANGYSLDLDGQNGVSDTEKVEFTMSGFSLSKVEEVDLEALKAATKGAEGTVDTTLLASPVPLAVEYINIGSVTQAYATYDYAAKTVTVAVNRQNVDKINLEIGGYKATVTHSSPYEVAGAPDPVYAKLDSASETAGIVANCPAPYGYTFITIPMNKIVITKTGDIATTTLNIEVVNEEQIINDKTRPLCQTIGAWDGTLSFALDYEFTPTVSNTFTGAINAQASLSNNVISFSNTTSTARSYYQGEVAALKKYGHKDISFKLKITSMLADDSSVYSAGSSYGISGNGEGWINYANAKKYEAFAYTAQTLADKNGTRACGMHLEILNDTSADLVLKHTNYNGEITTIDLGTTTGEEFTLRIYWNAISGSADIYVNGNKVGTIAKATTYETAMGKACILNRPAGYAGFNHVRAEDTENFAATISEYSVTLDEDVYTYPADQNAIIALGANAAAEYTDVIRLSYVQESRSANIAAAGSPADYRYSVRFVASINTLDAQAAGFEINLKGVNKVVDKNTTTVYTSLIENKTSGVLKELSADEGEYFVAVNVTGITPNADYTFVVRPYYVDLDGVRQYGQAYEVSYTFAAGANSVPFAQYVGSTAVAAN